MTVRLIAIALLLALDLGRAQQPPPPMSDQQVLALYERVLQLMEAGGVASAELGRASVPLAENMRQALDSLKFLGARQPQLHYRILSNLRAYLLISDSVPKPAPFPEMAKQQLAELRDASIRIETYFLDQIERLPQELRNPDRDNLKRYHDSNAALGPPSPGNPRVVFLGDSITDAWRLNEYFPGKDYVNRGISGQITGQMLGRFQADVLRLKPAAVVILAGTNDIARSIDPAVIQDNLAMMCALAEANKIKVLLAGILPVSDHHKDANPQYERTKQRPLGTILEMNRWIQRFAEQQNITYVDYYPALMDAQGQLSPNLADDGLHPNPAGYRIMAPIVLKSIEKALTPPQPEKKKRRLF